MWDTARYSEIQRDTVIQIQWDTVRYSEIQGSRKAIHNTYRTALFQSFTKLLYRKSKIITKINTTYARIHNLLDRVCRGVRSYSYRTPNRRYLANKLQSFGVLEFARHVNRCHYLKPLLWTVSMGQTKAALDESAEITAHFGAICGMSIWMF